jgi:hypothetical protein
MVANVFSSYSGRKLVRFHRIDGTVIVSGKTQVPVILGIAESRGKFLPLGAFSGDLWVPLQGLKTRLARNGNGH